MDQQQAPRQPIEQAAQAWRDLNHAESQICRLNAYAGKTPGMKQDFSRFSQMAAEARRTLNSVLKVTA